MLWLKIELSPFWYACKIKDWQKKAVIGKDDRSKDSNWIESCGHRGWASPEVTENAAGVYRGVCVYTRAYFDIPHGGGLVFTVKTTDLRGRSLSIGRFQGRLNLRLMPENNKFMAQMAIAEREFRWKRYDSATPSSYDHRVHCSTTTDFYIGFFISWLI